MKFWSAIESEQFVNDYPTYYSSAEVWEAFESGEARAMCKQAVAARGEYQCVEITSQAMHYCANTAEI